MKYIFFAFTLLFLLSCQKEPPGFGPVKSKIELLVNKKWQTTGISVKLADGTVIPNFLSTLPEEEKDDYYFYRPDLTFEINDNILKKEGSSSDILQTGSWSLFNSDLQMTSDDSAYIFYPVKIIELTEDKLKIQISHNGDIQYRTFKVIF